MTSSVSMSGSSFVRHNENNNSIARQPARIDTAEAMAITKNGTIYAPEAYECLWPGVQIVDEVKPIPSSLMVNEGRLDFFFSEPFEQSFPLVYIPEKISMNGQVMDFTIDVLPKMTGIPFTACTLPTKYRNAPLESGWRRMSKGIVSPASSGEVRWQHEARVIEYGARLPCVLEVAVFMHLVYASTGQWPYSSNILTRCMEQWDNQYPIFVGDGIIEGSDYLGNPTGFALYAEYGWFKGNGKYGVGAVYDGQTAI